MKTIEQDLLEACTALIEYHKLKKSTEGYSVFVENIEQASRAYRRVSTWPALLKALKTSDATYQDSLTDGTGCTCLRCTDASKQAQKAIKEAEQTG